MFGLTRDMLQAIFICPTFTMLRHFNGPSFKVCKVYLRVENHLMSLIGRIRCPSWKPRERRRILLPWGQVNVFKSYFIDRLTSQHSVPSFDNQQFITSFSESFLAVVKSFDPNTTPSDPSNITPHWSTFSHENFEMLFNRTESAQPNIRSFSTDPKLLERCL